MKQIFSTRLSENTFSFAMLLLRVGAGSLMIVHGFGKLVSFADKAGQFADPFNIGPIPSFALTIFAEFFCAALIILGLFTRLAAIPLIIAMAVALFYAHSGDFFGKGEMAALYLIIFITLLFSGPGKISLDKFIGKK